MNPDEDYGWSIDLDPEERHAQEIRDAVRRAKLDLLKDLQINIEILLSRSFWGFPTQFRGLCDQIREEIEVQHEAPNCR